jgi:alpha-glucosidase
VPLPWVAEDHSFGFGYGKASHLPQPEWMGSYAADVEAKDKTSTLSMYRQALALREELQTVEELQWAEHAEDGVPHYKRPGGWEVIMNGKKDRIVLPRGKVLVTSSMEPIQHGLLPGLTTAWLLNELSDP